MTYTVNWLYHAGLQTCRSLSPGHENSRSDQGHDSWCNFKCKKSQSLFCSLKSPTLTLDSKTDQQPLFWKGWVTYIDSSFKKFLANNIPENTVSYKVTGTVLITIFRIRKKAAKLSRLPPVSSICFSNPTLTPRTIYKAVLPVEQTSHGDKFAVNGFVITKLLLGHVFFW